MTEKSILQRQSMVFLSSTAADSQLHDALEQISELQFSLEEQKLNFETQLYELQVCEVLLFIFGWLNWIWKFKSKIGISRDLAVCITITGNEAFCSRYL